MRGKPFVEEGEGVVNRDRAKEGQGGEPRSVLDQRRSPSPPTSTSTLSSSLGGGGGSTDTAGVAAVSETPLPQKWVPSETTSAAMGVEGEGRREDWMSELQLQNIPMEIGLMGGSGGGGGGGGKCETWADDWESMFSETPAAALGQDQSFMRWFVGDEEDSSSTGFKQHQQLHHNHRMPSSLIPASLSDDFDAGAAGGFGLIDQGFPFDPIEGFVGAPLTAASTSVTTAGGFPIIPISTPTTLNNVKNPFLAVANSNPLFQSPVTAANSFPFQPQPPSQPVGPAMFFSENMEETNTPLFPPNHILNHHQQTHGSHNPSFFMPLNLYAQQEPHHHNNHQPSAMAHQQQLHHQHQLLHPKRHQSMVADPCGQIGPKPPFSISGQDHFLRRQQQQAPPSFGSYHQRLMKPKLTRDELPAVAAHQQNQLQQHQSLVDQLFKAAELVETGNSVNSREILARLNHQLSPHGKPLIRSAFYFKEALNGIIEQTPVASPPPSSSTSPPQLTPLDLVLKLNAYKNFSEISPVVQFTNFTCIQALLEELSGFDRIHIVDFDIGVGGQWSSFMQELSQRQPKQQQQNSSLKITALVTPSSHSHLELMLTRENLTNFAMEHGIPFEFNILSLDVFDPATILALSSPSEAIAVNIPIGGPSPSWTATTLHFIKQLSPKIVVSVDHNCDRSNDLPFSQHFLNALHSYTILLESIDAATAGSSPEVSSKIEKYLIQSRIENVVSSSCRRRVQQELKKSMMVPWRTMFASAGFGPIQLSNFTETQAECVLKRIQVRGFHVEKRQSSLVLFWQLSELVSVSAWKCC